MASSKEYRDFILEQLADLSPACKSMMGEYLLYVNGVCFGGIYDDRFLIKITKTNEKYKLLTEIPYKNAKPMLLVNNVDDKIYLENLILETIKGLKNK